MTKHSQERVAQTVSKLPLRQEFMAIAPHRRGFIKGAIGTAAGAAMLNSALGTVAAQDEAQEPVYGGHLNIAILRDPITLDPHVSSGTTSHTFQAYVYDNLTDYGPEGELIPSLAESWDISEDGLTYVFNLRRGVMFHHGGEFVADDVVYSIERMKDPEVNATLAPQIELIASCEAIDDYTVEMTLSAPYAPILDVLANWTAGIVSKEYSEGGIDYAVTMNGTGPYKQGEFETNIRYRFTINEQYWKEGLPYIETIEQRAIQDDTARVAALQAGDVDIATYTPWPFFDGLEEDPNFNLYMNNSVYNFVRFNHQVAPLESVLDIILSFSLIVLAWTLLTSRDLFRSVVIFIVFGMLMALVWLRLGAPDIALAEAAIGTGLTAALMLEAVRQLEKPRGRNTRDSGVDSEGREPDGG